MPQESQPPTPHGDPLQHVIEDNSAQQQSDAPPDAAAGRRDEVRGTTDRSEGRGSTANEIPASDEDDGGLRRRQYEDGADLVNGID